MCMSSPKTPTITKAADLPVPPPPADTATTLRGIDSATRNATGMDQKRKGRSALLISRDPVAANVPSFGAGINA